MARVKRGVAAKKRHKKVLEAGEGLLRQQEPFVPRRQRAGDAERELRLPRPQGEEGRVPSSVDPADQCRLPAERPVLQPVHRRSQRGGRRGRPQDPRRSRRPRRGGVRQAGRASPRRRSEPSQLRFDNPKIQRLRRLIGRRSARTDEGAFAVEGPRLIAEAIRAGWDGRVAVRARRCRRRPSSDRWRSPTIACICSDPACSNGSRPPTRRSRRSPSSRSTDALSERARRRRRGSSSPTGSPIPATWARSCDPPRRPDSTPSWSHREPSIRSTRRSCGHRPVRCSTCRSWRRRSTRSVLPGLTLVGTLIAPGRLVRPHSRGRCGRRSSPATRRTVSTTTSRSTPGCASSTQGRAESLNVAMATTLLCFESVRHTSGGWWSHNELGRRRGGAVRCPPW